MSRFCARTGTLLGIAAVAGALGVGASAAPAGPTATDASVVAKLLRTQTAHFNAGRWQALWRTYTPRFRRGCAYNLWVREQRAAKALIGARLVVRSIRVRVSRRRAHASYVLILGDRGYSVVGPPRTDLYVKIGGRWFDEGDQITRCRAGAA